MSAVKAADRRVLLIAAGAAEFQALRPCLHAARVALHHVRCFEEALDAVRTWVPHLLLIDYARPARAMAYETFVYAALPPVDPYRPGGPLARNAWQATRLPIVLMAGAPLATVPGLAVPLLARTLHFVPQPCAASHLAQLAVNWLEAAPRALSLDPVRGQVAIAGATRRVPPRGMDLLTLLAECYPRPCTAAELGRRLSRAQGAHVSETGIRKTVRTLRQALEPQPVRPSLILNQGAGYVLAQRPRLLSASPGCTRGGAAAPETR